MAGGKETVTVMVHNVFKYLVLRCIKAIRPLARVKF